VKPRGFKIDREARRRLAVARVHEGWSQKDVADFLGVNAVSVSHWVRAHREGGEDALRGNTHPGRPPLLADEHLRRLEELLSQGATAHGWANDLWTCPRVREVIRREFGVEYHRGYVSVLLRKRLGWTSQRPDQQSINRDDAAIESWVGKSFPAIMAAAAARGADVVFVDETGFRLEPTVRRTYAPRGRTPIVKIADPHARISVIGGVVARPGTDRVGLVYAMLGDNLNFRWPAIATFVRTVRAKLSRPVTVVWDRIAIHDCPALSEELAKDPGVVTELFPAYAPELNPADGIWRHIKHGRLPNYAPLNLGELRQTVTAELERLRKRPDLLRGFIRFTGLPVWDPAGPRSAKPSTVSTRKDKGRPVS
jgi:transposase